MYQNVRKRSGHLRIIRVDTVEREKYILSHNQGLVRAQVPPHTKIFVYKMLKIGDFHFRFREMDDIFKSESALSDV